jgi:hypothetical protein
VIHDEKKEEPEGIFPILIKEMIDKCCGNCSKGHGISHVRYDTPKESLIDVKNAITSKQIAHLSFPIAGKETDDDYQVRLVCTGRYVGGWVLAGRGRWAGN